MCPYPNLTCAGGHVNTTTGYQLVARTGIGISGLSLAREATRPLSGRSHGAAGCILGCSCAGALLGDGARREDGDVDVNILRPTASDPSITSFHRVSGFTHFLPQVSIPFHEFPSPSVSFHNLPSPSVTFRHITPS
ncbi:hypothetical protein JB92DRAFT_2845802, partial [Gautieria morchelliformis]